jgi:hypothetical protein
MFRHSVPSSGKSVHISSLTFVLQSLPCSSRWFQRHNLLSTCNPTSTLPSISLHQAVQREFSITFILHNRFLYVGTSIAWCIYIAFRDAGLKKWFFFTLSSCASLNFRPALTKIYLSDMWKDTVIARRNGTASKNLYVPDDTRLHNCSHLHVMAQQLKPCRVFMCPM